MSGTMTVEVIKWWMEDKYKVFVSVKDMQIDLVDGRIRQVRIDLVDEGSMSMCSFMVYYQLLQILYLYVALLFWWA